MLTGLFPVPKYAPEGGYTIDPSVVLAIARIESRFDADAVSSVGARGLMQLMPATARHVAGGRVSRTKLEKPAYNLALGQRYIDELLQQVNGNLFELAAAYNAGPANLSRWLAAREGQHDDPAALHRKRAFAGNPLLHQALHDVSLALSPPSGSGFADSRRSRIGKLAGLSIPRTCRLPGVPAAVQTFDAAAD